MSHQDKHPIDALFARKAAEAEATPRPEAWARLQAQMAAPTDMPTLPVQFRPWTGWVYATVALLLVSIGGWIGYQWQQGDKTPLAQATMTVQKNMAATVESRSTASAAKTPEHQTPPVAQPKNNLPTTEEVAKTSVIITTPELQNSAKNHQEQIQERRESNKAHATLPDVYLGGALLDTAYTTIEPQKKEKDKVEKIVVTVKISGKGLEKKEKSQINKILNELNNIRTGQPVDFQVFKRNKE
jgi:hypothetical protein